jgi:hypothetical protein
MAEKAEELERVARRGDVEPEPSSGGRRQILEMALAGQADQAVVRTRPSLTARA